MNFKKLYALLFIAASCFQMPCAAAVPTSTPVSQKAELSPELKRKALDLLSAAARETGQFKLAENRVEAQTIIADLMWAQDEAAARKIYKNALAELQSLFGKLNAAPTAKMNADETERQYRRRTRLADLRRDYLLSLAAHDAPAAIDARGSLKPKLLAEYDPLRQPELGLEIARTIAEKDADRAYSIYKEHLAARGITVQFIEAFKGLHERNSEVAARVAKDIFAVVKNAKIRQLSPVTSDESNPNFPARIDMSEIDFWQATEVVNAASAMNRRAARDADKKTHSALSAGEIRELVEKIGEAYLNEPLAEKYAISTAMTEITKYAPALARRIREKAGAETSAGFDRVMESDAYYLSLEEKNADDLAREADTTTDAMKRELLYAEAAEKALDAGDPEKAQVIARRTKKPENHPSVFERIEAELPLAFAKRGDEAAVRKLLARLKTNHERIAVLTELANTFAAKGEKDAAKKLLDEAAKEMLAVPFDWAGLDSAGKIAAAYASVEPERAFTIFEAGIAEMNKRIAAAIRDKDFAESGDIEADELLSDAMYRGLLLNLSNSTELLNNLARADFERTARAIGEFDRPEIRLFARLRLVESLLDPQAAEKSRKLREEFLVSQDEH